MTHLDNFDFNFDCCVTPDCEVRESGKTKLITLEILAEDSTDAVLIMSELLKELFKIDHWFDHREDENE